MTHTTIPPAHTGHIRPARQSASLLLAIVLTVLSAAAVLVPSSALALPEGRVYEMASPLFKGGYGAVLEDAAPNGENVVFSSVGAFAGIPRSGEANNAYFAHRETGKGWSITPVQPPFVKSEIVDFSSTLEYALGAVTVDAARAEGEESLHRLATPDTPENWEAFGEGFGGAVILKTIDPNFHVPAGVTSASGDLCHVTLKGADLLPESPFEGGQGQEELYDLARGCRGEGPWLRLVGVRNSLGPNNEPAEFRPSDKCGVNLGFEGGTGPFGEEQAAQFNAVSGDGSEIFFTTSVEPVEPSPCEHRELFVRVGGSRSVEVSRPVESSLPFGGCGERGNAGEVPGEVPCPGAVSRASAFFKGASEDGSKVFFTTGATLVPGDTDNSNKLYMAKIGCPASEPGCEPAQRRVTGMADASKSQLPGESAEVQGVVSMGHQAGYVYFVAHGVLTGTANSEGAVAVKGADNLYVFDSETRSVAFIGALCSGAGVSGTSDTVSCPSDLSKTANDTTLWGQEKLSGEAQSTPDGRFLVFSSFARLIVHGTQADDDNAQDVYRYDAETGILDRVSLGEDGHDTNGNDSAFPATIPPLGVIGGNAGVSAQQGLATRAISEDGSRIVFSSAEPLSADAINGHEDVYIWQKEPGWSEGRVSLISSGSSLSDDIDPVISQDGMSVFFTTSQGLVTSDTEHDQDVYDARVDGGFPQSGVEREPCSSDACQGALTNPAPLLVPGSVSQAPGQNYAAPVTKKTVKKEVKAKAKTKKAKEKGKRKAGKAGRAKRGGVTTDGSRMVGMIVGGRSGR